MSTARHHAEWLSLVEASGPFLSLPVLLKTFPSGLDAHEPEPLKLLRSAYEEWQDSQFGLKPELAIHRAWVEFVLKQTLELPEEVLLSGQQMPPGLSVAVAEQNETLRPDWVVVNPAGTSEAGKPRLLVQLVPSGQDLEKPLKGSRWAASPATRMMELLHACNVRLGLVTNGEHWMLVNAPKGETTGFISWYSILWVEEHLTLRAFRSLLVARRFFGVEDSQTLEALLTQSVADQQEVTDQLGYQVRRAVEVLVQAIARLDQDQNGTLLRDIAESQLYEAALTVMMRLVFLFCAEERGLLLLGDPIYDEHYAVSTLREQLRSHADLHGEEVLERRSDAWCRLLATFRAVYGGIFHDTLQLPAYGGSLFDPDRFPFLEGREQGTHWQEASADPLRINNRIVLHLLEALQILQIRVPGGGVEPRRLSFRALDIEQIGHVYEGLLDHTAVRATSTMLGLVGTRYEEPEVALAELEQFQTQGEEALLTFLKEQTGRSLSALKKALSVELEPRDQQRLRTACNNDSALLDRVLPFAGLIRQDTLDYPVVIPVGAVYMTEGVDRRQSGTHYTPRNLTEEIVQYTLEPLVYEGVAEGKPKEEGRLRSAAALLQLKICDMAMGSGAFLVQTCRYLAGKLVESWQQAEAEHPGQVVIAPEGTLSGARPEECPIPKDADERLAVARRIVADRCLYGVDKNPLAVEMAKLSLWLVTLAKGRPFTFLNHALKCGDSLLGVTSAEQIEKFHLNPPVKLQRTMIAAICEPLLKNAIAKRQELESFSVDDIQDLQRKETLLQEAEAALGWVKLVGDLLIGEALTQSGKAENLAAEALEVLKRLVEDALLTEDEEEQDRRLKLLREKADRMLDLGKPEKQPTRRAFHWALEFPEVFLQEDAPKGFSAIVGNPPFQGASKLTGNFGNDYRDFAITFVASGKKGLADLCTYFLLRATSLSNPYGVLGLVTTSAIAEGDSRSVGLDQMLAVNWLIVRAVSRVVWPGSASVTYSSVWLSKQKWKGDFWLNYCNVSGINSLLAEQGDVIRNPSRLMEFRDQSFNGVKVYGNGFVIDQKEAEQLIQLDSKNKKVIFPYITGQDINSHWDAHASAFAIRFFDWPLSRDLDSKCESEHVAEDFLECLKIVEERVKPERTKRTSSGDFILRKPMPQKWWIYGEKRPGLYSAIDCLDWVLAIATQATKYVAFAILDTEMVFSHSLNIIADDSFSTFALLSCSLHEVWARNFGSYNLALLRYSPTDLLETFPFPTSDPSDLSTQFPTVNTIGETYYTHRQAVMRERQEGLTKTYNRFHDANETASDIQTLRDLHIEMDQAVAAAYGWQHLGLEHGFHQTKQGDRFTISETARREGLDRLLELNHQRYAEEVAQGLHAKKGNSKSTKGKSSKKQKQNPEFGNDQLSLL